MLEGDTVYLKRFTVFHKCTIRKLMPEMGGTAKVDYYADGEPVICRQSELITPQAYKKIQREKRKKFYREARKADLAKVIEHYNAGRTTPMEMLEGVPFEDEAAKLKAATALSRQITSAKKLGFIT